MPSSERSSSDGSDASSVASDTEYAFRHLLVRDVAYAQIPRPGRAEKHRLAAEWIGSLAGGRSEDRSEMLAHHYGAALEFARASGGEDSSPGRARRQRPMPMPASEPWP